tara:strand:+ start:227 stop:412 length:186 start_codon:yes stop_codon:yes gene_type:complete
MDRYLVITDDKIEKKYKPLFKQLREQKEKRIKNNDKVNINKPLKKDTSWDNFIKWHSAWTY